MTLEQRLATYQANSGYVEAVEGAVLRSSDLALPFISIVQPTSADGTPGTFYRRDTGDTYEELNVIPLAVQPTRAKFPSGQFSRSARPECWSDDDIRPSDRARVENGEATYAAYNDGRTCGECEFVATFGGSANREAGMCLPSYMLALLDAETFETYMLRVQSSNSRIAAILAAKPHMRRVVMRMWLQEQRNDSGRWYAIKTSAVGPIGEDIAEIVNATFATLRGRISQGIDEVPPDAEQQEKTPDDLPF